MFTRKRSTSHLSRHRWMALTAAAACTCLAGMMCPQPPPALPSLTVAEMGWPPHVAAVVETFPEQRYRVYELPVVGDWTRARVGTWTGAMVIGDPTPGSELMSIELHSGQLPEPVPLFFHRRGTGASAILANEAGIPVGLMTSDGASLSVEIDLNGDGVADLVNHVRLSDMSERVMVSEDHLWALEELLAARNLFCAEELDDVEPLVFAEADPRAVSRAFCEPGGNTISIGPFNGNPGSSLDSICDSLGPDTEFGRHFDLVSQDHPADVVADANERWASIFTGAAALAGFFAAAGGGLPAAGAAAALVVVAELLSAEARDLRRRPGSSPPRDPDRVEDSLETWQRVCEGRERLRTTRVETLDDVERLASPVDNRCDDPVTANSAAGDGDADRLVLCATEEEERPDLGNVRDVFTERDDCDRNDNPARLCEPSVLRNSGGHQRLAWTFASIIGLEHCPPVLCQPIDP